MNKKKLGIVSYIGIVLTILQVLGFGLLILVDLFHNGVLNEYNVAALMIAFVIMLPTFIYYVVATIISVVVDLNKGKSKTKDILVSIAYVIPIIVTILIILLLIYLGARY